MRILIAIILGLIIISLIVCAVVSARSRKSIGRSVSILECALIAPVMGNLIIIGSANQSLSTVGYYIYFLGMDLVMFALINFILDYSYIKKYAALSRRIIIGLCILDYIQYFINIFSHHVFETKMIYEDGFPYYQVVPYIGQTFHRVLDYGLLVVLFGILIYMSINSPKIYAERYTVILMSLFVTTIWETYYIFSRTPVDSSMICFGVFGIMAFYFSIYYRPLRLLDRMLVAMASELSEAMFFFDVNGVCIWANEPGLLLINLDSSNLEATQSGLRALLGEHKWDEDEWNERTVLDTEEGKRYYYMEKYSVQNESGKKMGSFLIIRDNTEEQRTLEREKYNATHDTLTDLYTKEYLFESFKELLENNPDTEYYVIYANISDFKVVNDIFGNQFGDYVLKYIAAKIQSKIVGKGVAGRFVGDTFGFCIPVKDFDEAEFVNELSHFTVTDGEMDHFVLMHLGVYKVIDRSLDVVYMFDRARIALSTIKDEYQKYIAYFDADMRENVLWEQKITTQLSEAITQRQIVPFLQPIVDAENNVVGAEALVRWNHPEEGFLAPYKFIPVFEKNGMIADIDRYMWRCACEILSRWEKSKKDKFISINISPKDFYFMDVGREIRNIVKEFGIDQKQLRIEITESVVVSEQEKVMAILNDFRQDGFIVEMDDFGSGYSSLNMLKDMPIDLIKIDMAFLRKSPNDDKAKIILKNIVKLSMDLGLISLTEGVETDEQYKLLTDMGCKLFQGYHFAKPMPVEEFEAKYVNV
ncbi:MAG: EAL domain-containing protein [Eubacterium sp.]|nr:EAL domain-containing protein [Eubacterium sp.]